MAASGTKNERMSLNREHGPVGGTLQEHQEWAFQTEHQKIMRAMLESLDREADMQRQMRRMKESLIAVALRFQVAAKLAKVCILYICVCV